VYLCSHLMVVKLCALDPAAVLSGVEVRCVHNSFTSGAILSQLLHK